MPLAALPATAQLQPSLLLPGVRGVGLAALRPPLLNCVDGGPDAVAVYAPAAGLMHSDQLKAGNGFFRLCPHQPRFDGKNAGLV